MGPTSPPGERRRSDARSEKQAEPHPEEGCKEVGDVVARAWRLKRRRCSGGMVVVGVSSDGSHHRDGHRRGWSHQLGHHIVDIEGGRRPSRRRMERAGHWQAQRRHDAKSASLVLVTRRASERPSEDEERREETRHGSLYLSVHCAVVIDD